MSKNLMPEFEEDNPVIDMQFAFKKSWERISLQDQVRSILFTFYDLKGVIGGFNVNGMTCGAIPQMRILKWLYDNDKFNWAMEFIGIKLTRGFVDTHSFLDIVEFMKKNHYDFNTNNLSLPIKDE